MLNTGILLSLNEIVSEFYEAALGHVPWSQPLEKTSKIMGAAAGVFSLHDPLTRQSEFVFGQFGTAPEYSKSFEETYSIMSPFSVATLLAEVGVVAKPFDLIGREDVLKSRFFKEWCQPQGYHDFIGAVVAREQRAIYAFAFVRLSHQPLFDAEAAERLQYLVPHVVRAVQVSGQLKTMQGRQDDLVRVMDSLHTPVLLIDDACNILHINLAALEMARESRSISTDGGRLSMREPREQQKFDAAFQAGRVVASTLEIRGPHRMQMQLLKPSGAAPKAGFSAGGRTVVVIHPASATLPPPGAQLKDRFRLTVAEMRVLVLLMGGGTRQSISADLGIALATVKTHFRNLFSKTGTRRQADLVRLIMGTTHQALLESSDAEVPADQPTADRGLAAV